jgi:F-type H+-transporting ATPase subunit a
MGKKGKIIKVLDDGITPDPDASFLLDLSITKNVFSIFISGFLLCFILISVAKSYQHCGPRRAPRGLSAFIEPIILFVRDDIAKAAIPEGKVKKFLPYLLSLFFFIFFNNLLGLVPFFPGGANVTGNISVTLVLAMFTFFTLHLFANKEYWKHIFNTPGVPVWLKFPIPLMPVIELVGVFVKPVVLDVKAFCKYNCRAHDNTRFRESHFCSGRFRSCNGLCHITPIGHICNFYELSGIACSIYTGLCIYIFQCHLFWNGRTR